MACFLVILSNESQFIGFKTSLSRFRILLEPIQELQRK